MRSIKSRHPGVWRTISLERWAQDIPRCRLGDRCCGTCAASRAISPSAALAPMCPPAPSQMSISPSAPRSAALCAKSMLFTSENTPLCRFAGLRSTQHKGVGSASAASSWRPGGMDAGGRNVDSSRAGMRGEIKPRRSVRRPLVYMPSPLAYGGNGPRCRPESTIKVSPVTTDAPNRNQTNTSATSSAVATRFSGRPAAVAASIFS